MLKRTAIAGLLATVGIAAAGLVSGSFAGAASNVNTFSGNCQLHGTAKFTPGLKNPPMDGSQGPDTAYDFKTSGDPSASTCSGTLNGKDFDGPVTAYVKGSGQLYCSNSSSTGGVGGVVFTQDGKTITLAPLHLDVSGALTEVVLDVYDGSDNHARGHASFALGASPDTPGQCSADGVPALDFDAQLGTEPGAELSTPAAPTAAPSTSTGGSQTPSQTQTPSQSQQTQTQTTSQGAVQGERKASTKKKAKKRKRNRGLKCGKGHKKHTKAQGKRCKHRGKGKKKGHSK